MSDIDNRVRIVTLLAQQRPEAVVGSRNPNGWTSRVCLELYDVEYKGVGGALVVDLHGSRSVPRPSSTGLTPWEHPNRRHVTLPASTALR
jgi:hypothetical protein